MAENAEQVDPWTVVDDVLADSHSAYDDQAKLIVAALRKAGLLPNRRELRDRGVLVDGVLETDFHPAAKEAEYTCWVYDPSPWVPISEESQK